MKIKNVCLAVICLCLSVGYAYSQKSKVQTAYNYFKDPYKQYDKAKEAIDEAILHEQSMGMSKTWYYRGLIYHALYKNKKYGNLCDNCLIIAYEAFKKANEIDPKNEWEEEITKYYIPVIADSVFRNGVAAFMAKDYTKALSDFEAVQKMVPKDTLVLLNIAYAAEGAGNLEKAKECYSKLISLKFPSDNIYLSLSKIYRAEKDTAKALSTIKDGRTIYPDSINLMLEEINILLMSGRNEEATQALDAATKKDPNNESLYLALGSTYDNLANPRNDKNKDLPKPANYNDYMLKAEAAYKKGLSIYPDNYLMNYNLGAMYFNQAAELANQASNIKSDAEYAKAKEKFENKFKEAEPFLVKALEKNPKKTEDDLSTYQSTLISLKQLYVRTGETEKYERIKALIDQK